MTVRDLISELEQLDDHQQVVITKDDCIYEIRNVTQRKIIASFGNDDKQYVYISAGTRLIIF